LKTLQILGQKPEKTGSGVLVKELFASALRQRDEVHVVCAGYPNDDYSQEFGERYSLITFSSYNQIGDVSFRIPGMSDVMPYDSIRYSDLSRAQVAEYTRAYRASCWACLSAFRPDIIHIHHLWVLAGIAAFLTPIPCCITIHGTDLKLTKSAPQLRQVVANSVPLIRHFFSVSEDMRLEAKELYSIPEKKISVIGNGYNPSFFYYPGRAEKSALPVVLMAGKFVDWKGFRYGIRASARISTPHRLVILGTGPDDERKALLNEAAGHGILHRLVLPGHLSPAEVGSWMRGAAIFVLPSIKEPFGLVLLEALACGCPVIASASGGPKDFIAPRLISQGYSTLIPPLTSGDRDSEELYVRRLERAISETLARNIRPTDRAKISHSVRGREWDDVYRLIASQYRLIIESCAEPSCTKRRKGAIT
jgi:glycosyltransferase involved in cell wall biosynthesis